MRERTITPSKHLNITSELGLFLLGFIVLRMSFSLCPIIFCISFFIAFFSFAADSIKEIFKNTSCDPLYCVALIIALFLLPQTIFGIFILLTITFLLQSMLLFIGAPLLCFLCVCGENIIQALYTDTQLSLKRRQDVFHMDFIHTMNYYHTIASARSIPDTGPIDEYTPMNMTQLIIHHARNATINIMQFFVLPEILTETHSTSSSHNVQPSAPIYPNGTNSSSQYSYNQEYALHL